MTGFADRLVETTRQLGPLCVGIDPHAGRIPDLFGGDTPAGIAAWGIAMVEQARGRVAVVKPQVALFERHGPEGMAALQAVATRARDTGLLIIMDAKRGDIGSTAEGYAAAYLDTNSPFPCDCLTVNPYMGLDTLEPYLERAEANGKGIAVLTRTSNPGSADFEALKADDLPVWGHVAKALAPASERLMGETGWSSLMLVAGATGPDEARTLRQLARKSLFLVPGYGAQGASVGEALSSFNQGPSGLEGGVVSASRSVSFPPAANTATRYADWQTAIATAIDAAQAELKAATQA